MKQNLLLIVSGVGVGVLSGVFGVGGGIVLVPLLISVWQVARKRAHATSLVAVAVIAAAGSAGFALHGQVMWSGAALLGAAGVLGARIGGRFAQKLSSRTLGVIFGVFLAVVALFLLLKPTTESTETSVSSHLTAENAAISVLVGLTAGILSALLGVGGGVIMIPALTFLTPLTQHAAEGTALAAMVPIAVVGTLTLQQTSQSTPLWRYGVALGVGGVLGAPFGSWFALQLDAATLQQAFAGFMILTAAHTMYTNARRTRNHDQPSSPDVSGSSSNSSV